MELCTDNKISCAAQPDGAFRHNKYVVVTNVVVGGICFLMLTKTLYCVIWRVCRSRRLGMRWCTQ